MATNSSQLVLAAGTLRGGDRTDPHCQRRSQLRRGGRSAPTRITGIGDFACSTCGTTVRASWPNPQAAKSPGGLGRNGSGDNWRRAHCRFDLLPGQRPSSDPHPRRTLPLPLPATCDRPVRTGPPSRFLCYRRVRTAAPDTDGVAVLAACGKAKIASSAAELATNGDHLRRPVTPGGAENFAPLSAYFYLRLRRAAGRRHGR